MEIIAAGPSSPLMPVSRGKKRGPSKEASGEKDSFSHGAKRAKATPGPEFFNALQAGAKASAAASLVFGDPVAQVNKIMTAMSHPCGAPFLRNDGTIIVTDPWRYMEVDSATFSITKTEIYLMDPKSTSLDIPIDLKSISFNQPAFKEDGTFYAAPHYGNEIRGIKEGRVVLSLNVKDTIATPLALSKSKIAYCTQDGMMKVIGLDGKVLRKKKIPMAPTKESWHADGPVAVQFGRSGAIYVQTADDRLLSYGPRELTWSASVPRTAHYDQAIRIEESDDGSILYMGGTQGIVAIDAATGREKWSCDLGDSSAIAPIRDGAGTLYALTKNGTIALITPEGKVEHSFAIGETCDTVNQSCPRIRVDGHGNICVTPHCGKFQVFDREGFKLLEIEKNKLFREVDYLHDFILSKDGMRAFLIPGSGSFAEITLPQSIKERAASGSAAMAAGENASSDVVKDDEFVWIDGLKLQRQGHAARLPR